LLLLRLSELQEDASAEGKQEATKTKFAALLRAMDKEYMLSFSRNAEIRKVWYQVGKALSGCVAKC